MKPLAAALAAIACVLGCSVLLGCSAGPDDPGVMYMPDMVVSTPYDAHDRNPVLPNGMTLQPPPEGTVPQGYEPFHYAAGLEEAALAGADLESPIAADEAALARGRVQYETFCAVCHGARGDGDGSIVPPFPNPPSLHAERAIDMDDGRIFHVITHGQGFMPAYAVQVRADDRWRIIHHLRSLQGVAPGAQPLVEADAAPAPDAAPELAADAGADLAPSDDAAVPGASDAPPAILEPAVEPDPSDDEPAIEPSAGAPADAIGPAAGTEPTGGDDAR